MSLVLADRVRETTTSTGTGTITLGGAVSGFQSFSVIGNNNTTYYTISGGTQWEVGIGTYYGGTLARTTVIASSTGSKLDLAAGSKDVFVTYPAEKSVNQDANNRVLIPYTSGTTNVGSLNVGNATGHTDSGVIAGFTASEPLYLYTSLQNTDSGATSYASYAVNDGGHTAYGELGINNANYSYTAAGYPNNGFSTPLATFVESYGGPLVLGSWDNQNISFIVNGAVNTTDAMTINTNGSVAFNGQAGSAGQVLQSNATSAPTWVTPASGTVTSVSGTGTVSGLTLTGTVTNSGSLTLGGAITGFATSGANTNLTSVALTTGTVSTAPSSSTDIVNKSYADSIASGVNFHAAAQYATTAALSANTYNNGSSGVGATLTAVAVGTLTIDGYTLVVGDVGKRLLIKNEATQANNGVYTLTQAGTALLPYILTRATDYDTSGSGTNEVDQGDLILVINGTTNANTSWVQQTPLPITIGTTAIVFIQFAAIQTYTAGTGLTLATNQFSITNVGTAGTYGSSTQIPVLTTNAQGQITSVTNTSIPTTSGTVTSVAGTGTVNGLTLTGTVTSSGSLTLGGTLDLSSPPAIGGTTPAAGTHTTLSITGTTNQVSSVAVSSDPAAPSAGNLKTFAKTIAGGYTAPAFLNATNAVVQLQSNFGFKRIIQLRIQSGSTTISVFPANGIGVINALGTATSVSSANTNFFSRIAKVSYVSAGTAGSLAGSYYNGLNAISTTLGVTGTPNYGGFLLVYNFGIGDTVASPRTFNGLTSSLTAATNVEPSTLTNCIGVGQGAANTNLFVYYGGSAAQTPIDLGSNFPTGTSGTDFYQVVLFAPPSSNNTVYYQVTRLNTGNVATGTLTGTAGTVLPANTTNLYYRNWRSNNATASAVTNYQGDLYLETDY